MFSYLSIYLSIYLGRPCVVVAKVLYCGLEVREFELQTSYYVHFRT